MQREGKTLYQLRFSKNLILTALCLLLLGTPTLTQAAEPKPNVFIPLAMNGSSSNSGISGDLTQDEQEVFRLTNEQRTAAGCGPLTISFKLMAAARDHTTDMAEHDNMSHTGSDGSTIVVRYERVGYKWSAAAENVAAGYMTPQDVVNGWMSSTGHRKNILNCSITEIGVGYAFSESSHSTYWTQDFGTPQ